MIDQEQQEPPREHKHTGYGFQSSIIGDSKIMQKHINDATLRMVEALYQKYPPGFLGEFEKTPPLTFRQKVGVKASEAWWRVKVAWDVLRHGDYSKYLGDY